MIIDEQGGTSVSAHAPQTSGEHPQPGLAPEVLADVSAAVATALVDHPRATVLEEMFTRSMRENLAAVTQPWLGPDGEPDGSVFVITGDIPAMWLRDSAAQVRPYVILADRDPALAQTLVGILRRQLEFMISDPYANSFKHPDQESWHAADLAERGPLVWERKYEIDSLCFPLELAHRLWRRTGRTDFLDHHFAVAARAAIDVWRTEQDHEQSTYSFQRPESSPTDTLINSGRGSAVGPTGMTWEAFRPSDDSCTYHYNVPGNMFAAVALGLVAEIADQVLADPDLAADARALKAEIEAGIEQYGMVDDPEHGRIYAYEVDGLGNVLIMDDANMPSLLSMPLTGYRAADDPTYLATRTLLLSERNPFYYSGSAAHGIGSPHTPERYIWPIALSVQGLTAQDRDEKADLLRVLADTTGGTGLMHEGFDVDDPTKFTREWFSWANAMFCELVLDYAGIR